MLHCEIDLATAQRLDDPAFLLLPAAKASSRWSGRAVASLVLFALPIIFVGLLFRSIWNSLLAAGRAGAIAFEAFAHEYSRPFRS